MSISELITKFGLSGNGRVFKGMGEVGEMEGWELLKRTRLTSSWVNYNELAVLCAYNGDIALYVADNGRGCREFVEAMSA